MTSGNQSYANMEEVYIKKDGVYAETFDLTMHCPVCEDAIYPNHCEYCGKDFKYDDKIVCHGWKDYYLLHSDDGEHIHLECWHKRMEDGR